MRGLLLTCTAVVLLAGRGTCQLVVRSLLGAVGPQEEVLLEVTLPGGAGRGWLEVGGEQGAVFRCTTVRHGLVQVRTGPSEGLSRIALLDAAGEVQLEQPLVLPQVSTPPLRATILGQAPPGTSLEALADLLHPRVMVSEALTHPALLESLDLIALGTGARELAGESHQRSLTQALLGGTRLLLLSPEAEGELLERWGGARELIGSGRVRSMPRGAGRVLRLAGSEPWPDRRSELEQTVGSLRRTRPLPRRCRALEALGDAGCPARRPPERLVVLSLAGGLVITAGYLLLWVLLRRRPGLRASAVTGWALAGLALLWLPTGDGPLGASRRVIGRSVTVVVQSEGCDESSVTQRLAVLAEEGAALVDYRGPAGAGPLDLQEWQGGWANLEEGRGELELRPGLPARLEARGIRGGLSPPVRVLRQGDQVLLGNRSHRELGASLVLGPGTGQARVVPVLREGELGTAREDRVLLGRVRAELDRWVRTRWADRTPGEIVCIVDCGDLEAGEALLEVEGPGRGDRRLLWILRLPR